MRAARAILVGGLVVGTLDALDAIVFFGLRSGATPGRIFQGIAVGLLGPAARSGGGPTVWVGVLCHYLIATLIVLACAAIVRAAPVLRRHAVMWGMVYGLVVLLTMYKVVIPLSAIGGAGALPAGATLVNAVLIHLFGVGVPAALAARAANAPL